MDAYDEAIKYLTDNPDPNCIYDAWNSPQMTFGGCLFGYTGNSNSYGTLDRFVVTEGEARSVGCLTMAKNGHRFGPSIAVDVVDREAALALEVVLKADGMLPSDPHRITSEHLPTFARYQREIDLLLRRAPIRWDSVEGHYVRTTTVVQSN